MKWVIGWQPLRIDKVESGHYGKYILRAKYVLNTCFSAKQYKIKEPYGKYHMVLVYYYASDLANLFLILQLAVNNALSNKSSVWTLSSLAILSLAFSR